MSGRDRGKGRDDHSGGRGGRGFAPGRGGGGQGGGGRGRGDQGGGGRGRGDQGGGDRGRGGHGGGGGYGGGGYGGGGQSGGGQSGGGRGGGGRGGGGQGRPNQEPKQVYYSNPQQRVPPPNTLVSNVENKFQQAFSSRGLPKVTDQKSTTDLGPLRPGFGTQGKDVILWANYVEMTPPLDLVLYRYHIDIIPEVKGKKREQVVRLLLEMPGLVEFTRDLVTDFKSNLISRKQLKAETSEFQVPYRAEKEDEPSPKAKTYQITLKSIGTLTVAQLTEFLTSTNLHLGCTEKLPIIQALNILVRHYAKLNSNLATIGSSKTFSLSPDSAKADLRGGLMAIRGFFSSVRVATSRILININVSHGAFYNAVRLDQLIQNWLSIYGKNYWKLGKFLSKLRVNMIHLGEKKNKAGEPIPRIKTISGLATTNDGRQLEHPPKVQQLGAGPKDVEFFLETLPTSSDPNSGKNKGTKQGKKGGGAGAQSLSAGKYISVYDYFNIQYGRGPNPGIPVVNLGNSQNPMYLPADVCNVLPGQTYKALLDPNQTQAMMEFAVRRPWANATSIRNEGLLTVGLVPPNNEVLGRFGISVDPSLITVAGRLLTKPNVMYRQNKSARLEHGGWNIIGQQVITGGRLDHWGVLIISVRGRPKNRILGNENVITQKFRTALVTAGMAANVADKVKPLDVNSSDDPEIDSTIEGASKVCQLIFVVIPARDPVLYKRIKRAGDVKFGVHTVCMDANKLLKPDHQLAAYLANVALKVNLKLGGDNHLVGLERNGIISEGKTMIVGIDVTHPSPGSAKEAPSVAGMVASVDKSLGQWPASLRIQTPTQEIVDGLKSMLKSHLALWRKKNKTLPENILVYRDGVSEGQYELVLIKEVSGLRDACEEMYPPPDQKKGLPRLTVVIVAKRHHTRFYPTKEADADKYSNPEPGTVVDRGVTEARNWDFFMQAHSALKGTARPAHYYVVCDEIFTTRKAPPPFRNVADVLEDLTHRLCYMYGRATRSVSICMPAYYADIVCERARCYLSHLYDQADSPSTAGNAPTARAEDVEVHPKLADSMFYI